MRPPGLPKSGGRAKGVPNKATADTRVRIASEADPIGFLISVAKGDQVKARSSSDEAKVAKLYPTLEQRMHAAGVLARKIAPDAKDSPIRLALPPITTAADVLTALDLVAGAMVRGEITPGEALAISSVLETKRRAIETADLGRRVAALEDRQGSANGHQHPQPHLAPRARRSRGRASAT